MLTLIKRPKYKKKIVIVKVDWDPFWSQFGKCTMQFLPSLWGIFFPRTLKESWATNSFFFSPSLSLLIKHHLWVLNFMNFFCSLWSKIHDACCLCHVHGSYFVSMCYPFCCLNRFTEKYLQSNNTKGTTFNDRIS
jgi:prepilin signal peptidase PulO-like enzyme (type II secretory pathway)